MNLYNDEVYMVMDEICGRLSNEGIRYRYIQISSCAGILEIY
jgi:hypothetical protein